MAYREHLLTRTSEAFAGYSEEQQKDIYAFAQEVALESFRNGLAAGRTKNAPRKRSVVSARAGA